LQLSSGNLTSGSCLALTLTSLTAHTHNSPYCGLPFPRAFFHLHGIKLVLQDPMKKK